MWPGSVHDAKVFANSAINTKLRNAILPQTFQKPTQKAEKIPNYLIGNPAYPLANSYIDDDLVKTQTDTDLMT